MIILLFQHLRFVKKTMFDSSAKNKVDCMLCHKTFDLQQDVMLQFYQFNL